MDLRHPVLNFLFTYYKFDDKALLKWSTAWTLCCRRGRWWNPIYGQDAAGESRPTAVAASWTLSTLQAFVAAISRGRAADVMRRTAGRRVT